MSVDRKFGLGSIPGGAVYDGFVLPVIPDAFVVDLTEIDRVGEKPIYLSGEHDRRRLMAGRCRDQAGESRCARSGGVDLGMSLRQHIRAH